MNIDFNYWLTKLGWSSYDDGKTWHKANVSLPKQDAIEFEFSRNVAFNRSYFVCPDCGYKITPAEFVDEAFHDFIQAQEQEAKDKFYNDGTTKVERHTLVMDGFYPVKIRKIHGQWQMLAYTNSHLDERWVRLNLSEQVILENIEKYERKDYHDEDYE